MYDQDPLEFYGYEDAARAREYRKKRRLLKIEAWRSRPTLMEKWANTVRQLVFDTGPYMSALG